MDKKTARYHVLAGGSDEHPDLDYYTNDYPKDLGWKYPIFSVVCLQPVTRSVLDAVLKERNL